MELSTLMNKKSQAWGLDLFVAITIFLLGLIGAYIYAINFLNESQEILESLYSEGTYISDLILSEGVPSNWTLGDVRIPGILSNKKINQTKLDNFYQIDYDELKNLLNAKNEFYFNFSNMEVSGQPIEGIGNPPSNPENMLQIERFTIYKNKPIKFTLFIWN